MKDHLPKIVTLTSDFGINDPFVGIMKGVVLSINPCIKLVDITHGIEPQNRLQAFYLLKSSCKYFPRGTVHMAVIDPGVGGARRAIAVKTQDFFFVGPDNGIFSFYFDASCMIIELIEKSYFLGEISNTFHGRDIFAPIAGALANGTDLKKLGKPVNDPIRLSPPEPRITKEYIAGEVIHTDNFGNIATNISIDLLKATGYYDSPQNLYFKINRYTGKFVDSYSLAKRDIPSCLINSWGVIEIFFYKDNAKDILNTKIGYPVYICKSLFKIF